MAHLSFAAPCGLVPNSVKGLVLRIKYGKDFDVSDSSLFFPSDSASGLSFPISSRFGGEGGIPIPARGTYNRIGKNHSQTTSIPSTDEVYSLASEAAKVRPVDGLMFLERAQNSAYFNETEIRSLQQAELSLFSVNKSQIPNASRRYLRNLSLLFHWLLLIPIFSSML